MRQAANLTGIPYADLLAKAREEARNRPQPITIRGPAATAGERVILAPLPERSALQWLLLLGGLGTVFVFVVLGVVGLVGNVGDRATPTRTTAFSQPAPTVAKASARPTATPLPRISAPKRFSGSGDEVISISKPDGATSPAVLWIRGNSQGRHFAVKGLDTDGRSTGLFVNTVDSYTGITALDFRDRDNTVRLEISATGSWEIEVRSLASVRVVRGPGTFTGTGDEIVIVDGTIDSARITGNASERHFAVSAYGNRSRLLVNTVDAYDGRVSVPGDTAVIEVTAVGTWKIMLE